MAHICCGWPISVWHRFCKVVDKNQASTTTVREKMPVDQLQFKTFEQLRRVEVVPRVLLNEADAREALGGISRSKLYDLVSRGELRPVKLGPGRRSGIRFRIEELRDFAKRHLAEKPGSQRP